MRPACKLAGSRGIVSLLAGVQSKTRLSCADEMAAKAHTTRAAKMERFLILQVFAREMRAPREFKRKGLRKYLACASYPDQVRLRRIAAITRGLRRPWSIAITTSGFSSAE